MLHPECHHAYLIRRIDRLYFLIDIKNRKELMPELHDKIDQLKKIENKTNELRKCGTS